MVAVKGIYQVFTLGIRFGGWISVCSRAEWRIGNSVGGTWRDFIRGGRWWWHKTLKLSLFFSASLFFSCPPPNTPLWHIGDVNGHLRFEVWAGGWRQKMLRFFKGVTKVQDVRGWIVDLHCHCPLFRSHTYTSLPLCIVHCRKDAICLHHQPAAVLAPLCPDSHWGSSTSCLLLFS